MALAWLSPEQDLQEATLRLEVTLIDEDYPLSKDLPVYRATSAAVGPCSHNRAMSLVGAFSKCRRYSLLNCDALRCHTSVLSSHIHHR